MAVRRRRRRRTPPRGRGGRFVARHNRSRRRRRARHNAVVPVAWNPRRRRRGRRKNPLFLSRKGFSGRKHRGYRRLHRRRRHPRYWHNAVVPVAWNGRKRRSRRYRRNSILPISWNPVAAAGGVVGTITKRVGSLVDLNFWTQTALPAAGGFLGAGVVGGAIYGIVGKTVVDTVGIKAEPFVRTGLEAVGGAALSWAVGNFYSKKAGEMVWLGTVVKIAHSLLKAILPSDIASKVGLSGLGDDLSSRMREAVAARVQSELSGVGAYLTQTELQRQAMGEYVTDTALRMQPGYAPTPKADLKDYEVANTETSF